MGDDDVPAAAVDEPLVLELRVHGVNNTTPADLLDLPQESLKLVRRDDDERAAFWVAAPESIPSEGKRGHIPAGIRREAYSWGGLVRTESNTGTPRRAAVALAFQVFALPFSIGNAAMWTRRLTIDTDRGAVRLRANLTAGAARLFGLVLTLLFTSTAITVAVDIAALQCTVGAQCTTWMWDELWGLVTSWVAADLLTPSRVLAVFTLVPVLAVGLLVGFARLARHRYDTLHEREDACGDKARAAINQAEVQGPPAAENERKAVLAQPAFWSNRITGRLAVVHFAAAIALTTAQVALHVAVLGGDACDGALGECIAQAWTDATSRPYAAVFWFAVAILAVSLIAACTLPTMTITPRGAGGGAWSAWIAWPLLGFALGAFVTLLVLLAIPSAPSISPTGGLYGDDLPPLVVVTLGAALALSGLAWRPRGDRAGTAWAGCAPAVFMVISLTLAVLTSSAVISLTSIFVTGWGWPAALAAGLDAQGGLHVPDVFLAVGGLIAVALLPSILVLLSFFMPRKLVTGRARDWPGSDPAESLKSRVDRLRRRAAIIHLVEPAAAWITGLMAAAMGLGLAWTWAAFASQNPLPATIPPWTSWVPAFLVGTTSTLIGVGALLAFVVAGGVLLRKPGLIAIVWDITCYLPRTAQPFGPPCYAERAVPDISRQLDEWLSGNPHRHAVLAAHSMGAVISVSALGLLAATTADPTVLQRVSLLTFGVQLRTYFGRLMPELVGPTVLGTYPARSPRPWKADPWARDVDTDNRAWNMPWDTPPGLPAITRLNGALLPANGVPWINLWRLTDYLGFPAAAGRVSFSRGSINYTNGIDRYAEEIDPTVKRPRVVTHNDYIRVPAYQAALFDLESQLGRPDAAEGDGGEPPNG